MGVGKIFRRWISGMVLMLLFFQIYPVSASASVTVNSLKLNQDEFCVATIPQLENGLEAKKLQELNRHFRQFVFQAYDQFEQTALELRVDPKIPDHMKRALTFHAGFEVFRNDARFISLTQNRYQYTGGAHGMNWLTASNVNLQTGRDDQLSDLFVTDADYRGFLNQFVRREGSKRNYPLWGFNGIRPDSSFYLTKEGIVLFFQPYEIAPYSEGVVRMLVPYGDLAGMLKLNVTN